MDEQTELLEIFKTFLPKYLSPEINEDLLRFISSDFPLSNDASKVYSEVAEIETFLQGDAVEEIPFSTFNSSPPSFIADFQQGVLISNTCDITEENERMTSPFASFSLIFKLEEYLDQLRSDGKSNARIKSFENNLKANRLSGFMYLPQKVKDGEIVFSESFLRFDRIANLPASILNRKYNLAYVPEGNRLFSFSNYGFFLFLTKLSVHFCRIRENVIRSGF